MLVFDDQYFERMLAAHEHPNGIRSRKRYHRRNPKETAAKAMEMANTRCDRRSSLHRFALGFDLLISGVVRFAWIFIHFLVHLQGQARDISYLPDPHDRDPARRILAGWARLLFVFIRAPHRFY